MNGNSKAIEQRRVFFALWPDKPTVSRLADLQRGLPLTGRLVVPSNFHITLAFIGGVSASYVEHLHRAASAVEFRPFAVVLDSINYFSKPRVVWAGPSRVPAGLEALHKNLIEHLQECGYKKEAGVFTPHVSLARKSQELGDKYFDPIRWDVTSFALVESQLADEGPQYQVLQRYDTVAKP